MARNQIGSVWSFGDTSYGPSIVMPARTITPGSLVILVGRFEEDGTAVSVSDTSGATWQVQTHSNTNIHTFIAWTFGHPGQTDNVITVGFAASKPYRSASAIELDGSDSSDPAQVAGIVKSSAVLNHSMSISTPCDIFAIQGSFSTSTITPVAPAVALSDTSSVLHLFSTIRDASSSPVTIANTGGSGTQSSISLAFSYPGGSDDEKPVLTGIPNVGTKTSTTIQITGPAGSDNVGITAYEFSTDGGATWPLSSPTLPYNITSLTALTAYNVGMRAKDAANNISDPAIFVTTSTYRAGALGSTILLTTGPVDGNPAGILYNDVEAGDEGKWFSFRIIDQNLNGGTLDINPDGTFTFTGAASGWFTYQLEVDGVDVDENGDPGTYASLVTLYDQTTYRPTGDITTTGWTSTGANFYGTLDESPSSDTDYVTSPAVNASPGPLVMNITSIPAGSRIARIRARRTDTVGEIRQVFLDASDVEVGVTAWVALTNSFALYEPTVTLTGTATKVRLEVRS